MKNLRVCKKSKPSNEEYRNVKKEKYKLKRMRPQRNYQLGWSSGRLEIEVIHAKPVFGDVEFFSVCIIVNQSQHIRINGVCKY